MFGLFCFKQRREIRIKSSPLVSSPRKIVSSITHNSFVNLQVFTFLTAQKQIHTVYLSSKSLLLDLFQGSSVTTQCIRRVAKRSPFFFFMCRSLSTGWSDVHLWACAFVGGETTNQWLLSGQNCLWNAGKLSYKFYSFRWINRIYI